jgi:hypothetical protein
MGITWETGRSTEARYGAVVDNTLPAAKFQAAADDRQLSSPLFNHRTD